MGLMGLFLGGTGSLADNPVGTVTGVDGSSRLFKESKRLP